MVDIHVNDNTEPININVVDVSTDAHIGVEPITESVNQNVSGDKYYTDLAKEWAIKMDGKVLGEDYSSKYYANQTKGYYDEIKETVETIIEDAETVEEKAAEAQESADDAQESADIAQMYAEQARIGMHWTKINFNDWVLDGSLYKFVIDGITAVTSVYKGNWENKELITSVDITVTDFDTTLFTHTPFNGYVLGTKSIIESEDYTPATVDTLAAMLEVDIIDITT